MTGTGGRFDRNTQLSRPIGKYYVVNRLASLHERTPGWIKDQIDENRLLYVNKAKARLLDTSNGLGVSADITRTGPSGKKILDETDIVQPFLIFVF